VSENAQNAPAEAGTLTTAHVLDGWKQPKDPTRSQQRRAVGHLSIHLCMRKLPARSFACPSQGTSAFLSAKEDEQILVQLCQLF